MIDGNGDGIMGIGWKGRERRKVMEKGQGKGTDTLPGDEDIQNAAEDIEEALK